MKYYSTIVKIFKIFLLIFSSTISSIYAQSITDSPYSRYGIGIIQKASFNGNFGLGGAGIAWRPYSYKPIIDDSLSRSNTSMIDRKTNYINPVNPASFSNISLTTFEFSIHSKFASYSNSQAKMSANNTYFNHLAIAFPIKSWWGAGFGLRPFSSVGYDYNNLQSLNDAELVEFSYQGSGGTNQFFISNAFEIKKSVSLGFSASYIFGNISNERRVIFNEVDHAFNTLEKNEISVGDFLFDLGLQYHTDFKENYRFTFGATASLDKLMEANKSSLLRSYTGSEGFESFKDTIYFDDKKEVEIGIPLSYGIGLAFESKGSWIILADYHLRKWEVDEFSPNVQAANGHLFHLAYENLAEYTGIGSYVSRLGYRFGVHYNSSILQIDGNDIPEYGISFGTSLPLRKSFSVLVFGVSLGQRGTEKNNLIKENFINLHLGVTINDKWFIKSKYD